MAQGVTPDGIAVHNRIEGLTQRKLHARVVDNVLDHPSYMSRLMGAGKPFSGKVMDFTIKITDSGLGEFYSGLETLNTQASDTTIELSYAQTAFSQPIVVPMLEAFANTGPEGIILLGAFKTDEAGAEAEQKLGTALYGTGSGDQPLGLEAIVDDGTNAGTIGGQSRTTYSALNATVTDSLGTISLSKMRTLHNNISSAGGGREQANIGVTTKSVWGFMEQLYSPQVRASYEAVGYSRVPMKGNAAVPPAELKGGGGLTALTWGGIPIIKDDFCTSQVLYMLNENYFGWYGRTRVPPEFAGKLRNVDLGTPSTIEGTAALPSKHHGWFVQKSQMPINQAGIVGRYHVIGQMCATQPRRNGQLTGVLGV